MDAQLHWDAALSLGKDGPNFERKAASAPLYVYWLSAQQKVLGSSMRAHRVATAVVSTLRYLVLFFAVFWITGALRPTGLAVLLVTAMPALVHHDTVLSKVVLDLHILAGLLFVVARWKDRPTRPLVRGAVLGGLCGLALLSQLRHLFFVLPVLGYFAWARGWPTGARIRLCGAALVVSGIVLLLALMRPGAGANADYLPRGGVDIRIGNHEGATGGYRPLPGVAPRPHDHAFEGRMLAELEVGRPLSPKEANSHHLRVTWNYILSHPGTTAALAGKKIGYFLANFELGDNHSFSALALRYRLLRWLPMSFGLLLILTWTGVVCMVQRGQGRALWLAVGIPAAVAAMCVASYVTWRFRLVAVLPMSLAVAFALGALRDVAAGLREGRQSSVLPAAAAILAAALTFLIPTPQDAKEEVAQSKRNDAESRRVPALERRLARTAKTPEKMAQRVVALQNLGRHTDAFLVARAAAGTGVGSPAVHAMYLQYLLWLGDYGEARAHWDTVRSQDPQLAHGLRRARRGHYGDVLERFVLADQGVSDTP